MLILKDDEDDAERDDKIKKFLSAKLECEHDFKSLIQIGSEMLICLIFSDQLKNQREEFLKKLIFGNLI